MVKQGHRVKIIKIKNQNKDRDVKRDSTPIQFEIKTYMNPC